LPSDDAVHQAHLGPHQRTDGSSATRSCCTSRTPRPSRSGTGSTAATSRSSCSSGSRPAGSASTPSGGRTPTRSRLSAVRHRNTATGARLADPQAGAGQRSTGRMLAQHNMQRQCCVGRWRQCGTDAMTSPRASSVCAGFCFARQVIAVAVRWYLRYGLCCRGRRGAAGRARCHRGPRHGPSRGAVVIEAALFCAKLDSDPQPGFAPDSA
jgi:hypothetical protein